MLTLALAGSLMVDLRAADPAAADLLPLPDEGPLPIPNPFGGNGDDEENKKPKREPRPELDCSTTWRPFLPHAMDIPALEAWVPVVGKRRDRNGVPGVPPTSPSGRNWMAFDLEGGRPGDDRGNALLNAHTWPDGTALGNALLQHLNEGDELVVRGNEGRRICYRVTDRVQVPQGDKRARKRYYNQQGDPQLAITVCSGRRLGPGEWSHRTMWFASPVP